MNFWHFSPHDATAPSLHGSHDLGLVVVSVLVSMLAALAALSVIDRLRLLATTKSRLGWLTTGSIAMGSGIWAMHFTGMLAFSLPAEVRFLLAPTLASFAPAVIGSLIALHTLSGKHTSARAMFVAAAAFAVAIAAMHFIGMEAMHIEGAKIAYDPPLFALSIVLAYGLALTALYVRFIVEDSATAARRIPQKWVLPIAAVAMGIAVAGMHYTAMSAAHFVAMPEIHLPPDAAYFEPGSMVVAVVGLFGIIAGLTIAGVAIDRRINEAASALIEGQLHHHAVVENMRDGLIVVSSTGRIQSINPAATSIFGYQARDVIGEPLGRILPLEDNELESYVDTLRDAIGLHKDRGNIALKIGGHAIQIGQSRSTMLMVRVRDEVETLERRLRRLAAAVEHTEEAILIMDADLRVAYMNPSFERAFASTARNSLGVDVSVALGIGADSPVYANLKEALARSMIWQGRIVTTRRDGSQRQIDMSVSPVRNEINLVTNFVAFLRDMTSKLAVDQQLQQAQRRESAVQAAADVAKEISAPIQLATKSIRFLVDNVDPLLDAVWNYRKLLEPNAGATSLEQHRASLEQIGATLDLDSISREIPRALAAAEDSLARIASIVGVMNGVSPLDANALSHADINAAIREAVATARTRWASTADIELDLADNLPPVPCYVAEINKVLLSLLANAANTPNPSLRTARKTRVVVATRVDGDSVEITVRDNGPGVPEGTTSHMFDRGQPLADSHDAIVKKHGGALTCDSLPGVATTFRIRIPLQRTAAERRA